MKLPVINATKMSGTYENYSLSVLVLINFAINHDDQFCENQDVTI